ncbi:MAG: cytidine deaminase [Oscillospiraceae bacterium]|nr:cytidine deaminase [Oscillospiraceae bacterium]
MTFEAIYNSAVDVMNRLAQCGERFGPDKTVCVISTRSGRIFYGVSRTENMGGMPADVHAEIVACREMQAMGESAIDTLILLETVNRSPMLPCSGCAGYLMSISPENAGAMIAMPDRMFRLSELVGGGMPPMQGMTVPKSTSAKGDLLKDRVSDIMSGIDDDDEDDEEFLEELDKPKKKKLFGLF